MGETQRVRKEKAASPMGCERVGRPGLVPILLPNVSASTLAPRIPACNLIAGGRMR
jgi:hypothetical protein